MKFYDIFDQSRSYFAGKKAIIFDMDGTLVDSMSIWFSDKVWRMNQAEQEAYMHEQYINNIEPKAGALELCKLLKDAGIPFCIATNTPYRVAKPMLEKYGLEDLYDFYIDCEMAGATKQKPDIYDQATARLGVSKDEIVVFEDLFQSAKTAKTAGYCTVGVYDLTSKDNIPEMKKMCDDYVYNLTILLKK